MEDTFSKDFNDKRQAEFTKELKELLLKHDAEIELTEHSIGYPSTYSITFALNGFATDHDTYVDCRYFELGSFIDGN